MDYRHLPESSEACTNSSLPPDVPNSTLGASTPTNKMSDGPATSSISGNRWALSLYAITTILMFADQNLMSPNLSAMAQEFQFSDLERDKKLGGDIALAFWMFGLPASFLIGCLTDRYNRSYLFAFTVGIGEGACLLTYFSQNYTQLYICRAVTGFSIGGATPLIYSVLGDLFAAQERHGVSALVTMGCGVGISLGQGIAGFLGPTFGWRLPFLVVSVPALLAAALVGLTVKDPERGGMEQAVLVKKENEWTSLTQEDSTNEVEMTIISSKDNQNATGLDDGFAPQRQTSFNEPTCRRPSLSHEAETGIDEYHVKTHSETHSDRSWYSALQTFLSLLSYPTVILAILQGAPGCVPWGIVNTYLNDFLANDREMTVEFATFVLLFFGFGNFLGIVIGGMGGNYLYSIDSRYPAILAGTSAILGCFPFWYLLNSVDGNSNGFIVVVTTILAGLGTAVTGPIVKATLQNVTLPNTRGQAFAVANIFDDFGRGLGPVFVAMLISIFGRTRAFNFGVLGWVLCGFMNLAIFATVARDEGRIQDKLQHELSEACREHTLSAAALWMRPQK